MTSPALTELASRLDEVKTLAASHPTRVKRHQNIPLGNAITRSCIVLLAAHLEGYLEDVVVESLDALVFHHAPVGRIPVILRALHVEDHLRTIEGIKDRNARAPRIEAMFQNETPMWAGQVTVTSRMLRPTMVCSEMSNPGSKAVERFLVLLGVDIAAYLGLQGKLGTLTKVDGLVGRRNAIAHGEMTTNVTLVEVDDYIVTVEELAREVDDALAQSVQNICSLPSLPW